VLKLPTPFFYCRDDELAEWILAHKRLARPERQLILKRIRPDR
jgi:succinate dehydrogenase flavin-adding protein (antitoxin of CptAB toxin-antitoxin module)